MDIKMDPARKQLLDDTFDAFTMLAGGNLVSLYDVESQMTRYGAAAVDLFNLPGEYIPAGAMDWGDYVHPEDRKRYYDIMGRLVTCETLTYDLAYRVRTKDGAYSMFRAIGAVLRAEDGNPSLIGGMLVNEGLMENTDPVTVLRNQYGFFDDLSALMKTDQKVVALLIGIGRLANINEVHGYGYGNRVLQQAGWLIQESVGQRGTVYRMNGAKFAFLTSSISEREVSALYDTIRVKLQRGIRIGGVRCSLTASGGMVSARGVQMDAETVYSCLSYAYKESKERKYGELVDYNGRENADVGRSLEMINEVRSCVLDGCKGFQLYYQPVFNAQTEKPIGVEALVRWRGETHGEIPPLEFIPILERDFVFEELGSWILRRALTDGAKFLKKDPRFIMGVNISPAQLEDEYFIDSLLQTLSRTGFPPQNLSIELTKGCRLLDIGHLKGIAADLRNSGVRVIIDDFGSGFDSLEFLKELSPDFVKFDLGLVKNLEESEEDRQAVRRLSELATIYGPNVCAKGVETAGMRDILRQYPISSMQGHYYAKPLPFDEILSEYLA